MKIELIKTTKLVPYASNAKLHNDAQVSAIAGSIREFGFTNPVLIDGEGTIIAGHGRVLAAQRLEMAAVPCIRLGHLTEAQVRAYRIADNRLAEIGGGWDEELLQIEVGDLGERLKFDVSLLGFTTDELAELGGAIEDLKQSGALAEKFIYPPFSVLDARSGWWQDRKRRWIEMGIESEEGRGSNLLISQDNVDRFARISGHAAIAGTSIFDPVLCELLYRWFVPSGGAVLDPFAGGSVRGIIAGLLGLSYTGVDLREEQVAANIAQAAKFTMPNAPSWHVGDSNVKLREVSQAFDFFFSCPPYFDLEKYSDDASDLSNMSYGDFLAAYREIIRCGASKLRDDRLACFVVSDIRDASGRYRDFVSDTISAFRAAGLKLYNEAILVTTAGSLPLRVGHQFSATRKLGKTHQNVLIFVQGDPRKAAAACGEVETATAFPNAQET